MVTLRSLYTLIRSIHKQDDQFLVFSFNKHGPSIHVCTSRSPAVSDFVKEKVSSIYNFINHSQLEKPTKVLNMKEVVEHFQVSDNSFSFCPSSTTSLDESFQNIFLVQFILLTYISPSVYAGMLRILLIARTYCTKHKEGDQGLVSREDMWNCLSAVTKCVVSTANAAAKTAIIPPTSMTMSFLFVPSAIQCSLQPYCPGLFPNVVAEKTDPKMQITLNTFTEALVARHQKVTEKHKDTRDDGQEWQLVDMTIPDSLRADQLFLQLNQQLKEDPPGDDAQGGNKQTPKASNKETSRTVDNQTYVEKNGLQLGEEYPAPHPGGNSGKHKHTQKASSIRVCKIGKQTLKVSSIETSRDESRANGPNIEVKKGFQDEEAPSANSASSENGKLTQEQSNMEIPRKNRKDSAHSQQTCSGAVMVGLQLKEAPTEDSQGGKKGLEKVEESNIEMTQEVEWDTCNAESHEGKEVLQETNIEMSQAVECETGKAVNQEKNEELQAFNQTQQSNMKIPRKKRGENHEGEGKEVLKALMQEMHELAKAPPEEDIQMVEAKLQRFAQKYIPNAKKDHSRTIGFIFLMTGYCLSCHIDDENPFFYVMHAIISAASHAKKAGTIKKWSVLCNMVQPAEVYSNSNHPLNHYIAHCVGRQQILQPHNNALGYYQTLYQERSFGSLKYESQTRLIGSVPLRKIISQREQFSSQKMGKESEPEKQSESKCNDSKIEPEKRGKIGSVQKPNKTDKLAIKPKVRVRSDVSSPSVAEKTSTGKRRSPRNNSKIEPEKKRGKTGSVQKPNKTDNLAIKPKVRVRSDISSPSVAEKTSSGKRRSPRNQRRNEGKLGLFKNERIPK